MRVGHMLNNFALFEFVLVCLISASAFDGHQKRAINCCSEYPGNGAGSYRCNSFVVSLSPHSAILRRVKHVRWSPAIFSLLLFACEIHHLNASTELYLIWVLERPGMFQKRLARVIIFSESSNHGFHRFVVPRISSFGHVHKIIVHVIAKYVAYSSFQRKQSQLCPRRVAVLLIVYGFLVC